MNFRFRVSCVILIFSGVLLEACITLVVCFVNSVTEGLTSNENKPVGNAASGHGSLLPSFSQPFVIKNRFPGNARLTARSGQFKSWFCSLDKKCFSSRLAPLSDLELLGRSFSIGNEFRHVMAFFGSSSRFRHEDTSVLREDTIRISLSAHDAQGMLSVSETTTTSCFSEPCAKVGSSGVLDLLLYPGHKKTHPLHESSEISFTDLPASSKHTARAVVDSCQRSRRGNDHLYSLGGGALLVCPAVWEVSKATADYITPLYFYRRQKCVAKHNDATEFQMLHSSLPGLKLPGAPPRRLSAAEEERVFPGAQLIPATEDGIGNCKADRGTSCGRFEAQGLFVDPPILVGQSRLGSYCQDTRFELSTTTDFFKWSFYWTCPNCATPLKRVVNGYSGMVIDVPGEAIFEAAMAAKRVDPSLSVFKFTLRVDWAYNWGIINKGTVERAASVEYKPFVPYFSVADGTVWTVKNDARRFSFSIGVYACAPHEKTVKWSVRSENDQRPATELLEIEENRTDMQFTVSVAPVSLLPGERYFITLEVSYPDSPTYKGSTTVQIDVEKPRSPIAHLQMPDSVDACDAFQIDASASIANAPDSRLAASWKCLSGCNAAINTLLQRQENMLRFTVGSDVVFALAKTHRGGNTGGSTFRLQIQLTLANSYKMTSTVTSITRIAAHLQPPVITSLTPTAASISHTAPYTMDVNLKFCAVAESVENEGLDIRWTVKSKEDSRDLNQILQMSNNALRGTFPAYSLKPAADYTVNVAVTYLDDTRVKTYASFEIHVLPASGFPPVIHLQYPTVVRKCQTIHLDATTTTSSASEPGLTVRWGCDASDCPQKIKELAEAEKTLALAIPDDIVYAVVEQLLGSPASAESLTFTIVLEVQDRDMRTASASATIMLTKDLAPPTVSPTTDTSFELAPSQTATMGIAVAQCPHLPAATGPAAQVEWSVSPDGQPFKLDALVELDRDTPPLSATTKENSLVRGLAYTFEARAFYQGAKHLSNSVAFLVMVDQAGTVPPSVSLTGPEDIVLTACEGLSVHSTASSGTTDDPTLHIYWICLDAECPAEYIKFLESQSDHTELFIPPDMVYKLAKANRQPAATTFTHRLGVVVLNSDRRQATDHVQIEIATYPATPTLQPAGPLNFNINAAEAVTMAVSASYCTHADDATFMWEIKSDFEKRPSDELLTESLDGHRATVAGGKLIAGVTYTVVVSLTYGDLPSTASLLFEIIVAPPEQPAAQPNAIVTGPSGIQGACDPFKLIGTQSQAQTNDAVLLASWNCLGQCPSTFVKAARTAKELTLTMDAATVYQAVKEFKERNPLVNTFDVEFELTVTDSQQNMARSTTRVTLQSSLTPPILRATSQQTLEIDSNEGVTLSAAVDYCEHVKTGTSSGLAVEWRSISADPRPFEDLFSVSDNQLTAAAEPGSLHAGTNYTIKLQVAYAGERQHTTIEYTIRVLEATVFLSFNLDTLHEAPITPVSV